MRPLRRRLLVSWLLLVAAGGVVILLAPHGPVRHWAARTALPPHHRLTQADLAAPPGRSDRLLPDKGGLLGHYTAQAVAAGQALPPDDVATLPDLAALPPRLLALLAAERRLVDEGALNADTEVALCHGTKALPAAGRVTAVLCARAERCAALVTLAPANVRWLADAGGDGASLELNAEPGLRCRVDLPPPGALRDR
ncbi:SAF domain-containing protein [Marinimicrococcus flavescens]|uniref:SAF domain-containing protein n=1 Tax=Marinimicrococcus flavescens TaxID=3031815 RepID=A0AAP3UYW7_9PROT|nr:hypothetical protein [Marinimicrococcus flavescens]